MRRKLNKLEGDGSYPLHGGEGVRKGGFGEGDRKTRTRESLGYPSGKGQDLNQKDFTLI